MGVGRLVLLRHVQSTLGEYPESRILWDCACAEDPAARVAGVNRGLEGLACDVFAQLIHLAQKLGDPLITFAVGTRAGHPAARPDLRACSHGHRAQ